MRSRPHVVVLGAGFGGLWAAKQLDDVDAAVTLVDRHNYHTFFPLLYQVAAAELQPGDIAHPIRRILRGRDLEFRMATVTGIDLDGQTVRLDRGELRYDRLIIALGSRTRHFGIEGAAVHAFGLRTLDDAIVLRNHVLERFERAHQEPGAGNLTFVIVGGGPTGVEFAGALQELINGPLRADHRLREPARIVVVEAGDHLLAGFPARLSRYARRRLERMGVEVRTGTAVTEVGPDRVVLSDEEIPTSTTVWTAGVGGDPDVASWGLPAAAAGRVPVADDLSLRDHGHPEVFLVGDLAAPETPSPMVAQNAMQQGRLAARNVARQLAGEVTEPYSYRDYGAMAVIGRNAAVAQLWGRVPLTGYAAWITWLALHLLKLVGFRNRFAALMSWSGDYLFRDRVARLIIGSRR